MKFAVAAVLPWYRGAAGWRGVIEGESVWVGAGEKLLSVLLFHNFEHL